MKLLLLGGLVLQVAACTTSTPVSVDGLKRTVGTSLPGARGLDISDQDKIDETVARLCATKVFNDIDCQRHSAASKERRS